MAGQGEHTLDVTSMVAGPVTEEMVTSLLGDVIDPELGVDIVNLGLIYNITIEPSRVGVRMTLTTPGCPLHAYLDDEIGRALAQLPGSPAVDVDLVWEPAWTPDMMTVEAKRALGWAQ